MTMKHACILLALAVLGAAALASVPELAHAEETQNLTFVANTNIPHMINAIQNGTLDASLLDVPPHDIDDLDLTGLRITESTEGVRFNIYVNPAQTNDTFNPFAYREVRFALNHLIDRDHIVREILRNHGTILHTNVGPGHPDYATVMKALEDFDLAYNTTKANQTITRILEDNGAVRNAGGMWMYNDAKIELNIMIRADDPIRKTIGERLAGELVGLGFAINKTYPTLSQVFATFKTDPAQYEWHIYTGAYSGYPVVKIDNSGLGNFYAPWLKNMPGDKDRKHTWFYENQTLDNVTQQLYNEEYENDDKRNELVALAASLGVSEAVRIFLATQDDIFVSDTDVTGIIPVQGYGISSRFSIINAQVPDGHLDLGVRYLSQDAWNTVDGFRDVYSGTIWDVMRDPSIDSHPHTADLIPVRANWTQPDCSETDRPVPANAVLWDRDDQQWANNTDGTYTCSVTFNYTTSNWHHGQMMDINDIMYGAYFGSQWRTTNSSEDTYDLEYSPVASRTPDHTRGILVDPTDTNRITVYLNYTHDDPDEIVRHADMEASIPWEIFAATELAAINNTLEFSRSADSHTPKLSLVNNTHADILSGFLSGDKIHNHTSIDNHTRKVLFQPGADDSYRNTRYNASMSWIQEHNHAAISNGPFYLDTYNPEKRAALRAFDKHPFSADQWDYLLAGSRPIQNNTVMVGSIAPLTGGAAGYGLDISEAVTLAIADHNSRGTGIHLELAGHSDSATLPANASQAFTELYNSNIRVFLGPALDGLVNVTSSPYGTNSVFLSCCSVTTPYAADDNLFRISAPHESHGQALAALMNASGTDNVIMVGRNNIWITDLLDRTTKALGMGPNVLKHILYDAGMHDEAITELQKRLNQTADTCNDKCSTALVYIGFEDTVAFLESLHDNLIVPDNIPLAMYGADANTVQPSILESVKAQSIGMRLDFKSVQPIIYENDVNLHVRSELGRAPTVYAYTAYDSVMILGRALVAANSTVVEILSDEIQQAGQNHTGAIGTNSFDANGDLSHMNYGIWSLGDEWTNTSYYNGKMDSFVQTAPPVPQYNTITPQSPPSPSSPYGLLYPISGDWDGDGDHDIGTVGIDSDGLQHFTLVANGTTHDIFSDTIYEASQFVPGTMRPLVGDWDGDGDHDIGAAGILDESGHLHVTLETVGAAKTDALSWTVADEADYLPGTLRPLVGDWDGDGDHDIGTVGILHNGMIYHILRVDGNVLSTGATPADRFLPGTLRPLVGDWNGDDIDDIGYRGIISSGLQNFVLYTGNEITFDSFVGDYNFYVPGTMRPLVGDWDGDGDHDIGTVGIDSDGLQNFTLVANGTMFDPVLITAIGDEDHYLPGTLRPLVGDWDGDGDHDIGAAGIISSGFVETGRLLFTLTPFNDDAFETVFVGHLGNARDYMTPQNVTYSVTITNTMQGQPLTPPVVALHDDTRVIYDTGAAASTLLKGLAENGAADPLYRALEDHNNVADAAIGNSPLFGNASTATLQVSAAGDNTYISFASMLVCTNDGFTGLDSLLLRADAPPYTVYPRIYDAGTEVNTEDFADLPPPCQGIVGVMSDDAGTGMSDPTLAEGGVITAHPGLLLNNDLMQVHTWDPLPVRVEVTAAW